MKQFHVLAVLAAATIPGIATASVHAGNPQLKLDLGDADGWTVSHPDLHDDATATYYACTGGGSATGTVVTDNENQPIGWTAPQGTWCSIEITWSDDIQFTAYGPDNRTLIATIDLNSVTVDLHQSQTLTGTSTDPMWILELGDGAWLKLGEAYMDPNETQTVTPTSGGHDSIRNALEEGYLYEDSNKDGVLSAVERAAGTVGESPNN